MQETIIAERLGDGARRQQVVEGDSLLYYIPIDQSTSELRSRPRLVVRVSDSDPDTLARIAETARKEALAIEPGLRMVTARPLTEVIAPQLRAWQLGASLFSVFGVLALVVAAIGLYSVVTFEVEGRRRELGVRTALGASSAAILRLVVTEGVRLAAIGVVIGLVVAWLVAPPLRSLLYGTVPQDVGVFTSVAIVLVIAATLASAIPALKATRIDPSEALRHD